MGACDGCYPNIYVLSNVLRAFLYFGESLAEMALAHASIYDNDKLARAEIHAIFSDARNGRAVLMEHRPQRLRLRFPKNEGFFTPIF